MRRGRESFKIWHSGWFCFHKSANLLTSIRSTGRSADIESRWRAIQCGHVWSTQLHVQLIQLILILHPNLLKTLSFYDAPNPNGAHMTTQNACVNLSSSKNSTVNRQVFHFMRFQKKNPQSQHLTCHLSKPSTGMSQTVPKCANPPNYQVSEGSAGRGSESCSAVWSFDKNGGREGRSHG